MKVIPKENSEQAAADARKEITNMSKLNHPGIVRLIESFENDSNIYMVMEYIEGGELFPGLLKRRENSEQEVADIVKQM